MSLDRTASALRVALSTIVISVVLFGCANEPESANREAASPPAGDGAPASGERFVGRVTETMDAGGYTYVRLERGDESIWAAGPQGTVEVGEELGVSLDMKMNAFHSPALDRTFDAVYFVNAFERGGRQELKEATEAMGSAHARAAATDVDLSGITKAKNGHTVAGLWQDRRELAGADVTFRGRVVKVNTGIMGRNWLHIQDGTGDSVAGDHDVAVTTQNEAAVGDLVLVKGTVAVDKDFGGGYRYGLIVEDATVTTE